MVGSFEDASDEIPFGSVQFQDLFFDRVFRDEAIDRDRTSLADAVRSVSRLIFDGRIPPRIEMNDVIGSGEVQASPARFERDQKEISFAPLEGIDSFLTLLRRRLAVEVLILDPAFVECLADQAEVLRELAEDERAMSSFPEFIHGF